MSCRAKTSLPTRAVYRIHGPFLFGATDKFADILAEFDSLPPIVILRLRNMTAIDATGLGAIRDLADLVHASGRSLLLCGAREQPAQLMHQAEFERHVGTENICSSIAEALQRAASLQSTQHTSAIDEICRKGGLAAREWLGFVQQTPYVAAESKTGASKNARLCFYGIRGSFEN